MKLRGKGIPQKVWGKKKKKSKALTQQGEKLEEEGVVGPKVGRGEG